jgi:hypothetical protein
VKISRRHGRLRLQLAAVEADLLAGLLEELETTIAGDADDPVVQRLFPAAYPGDDDAEAEYSALTRPALESERSDRIAACRAELAAGSEIGLAEPDAARRWIQALNDVRLALGTRLGVTEDDDHDIDPGAPDSQPRAVYYWLTAVQDAVVTALMR